MKIVIVGGAAGGASAAARLRRLSENDQIIMLEKEGYVSSATCGFPYYVGGVITDARKLQVQTPAMFWRRFNIEARINSEVILVDRGNKTVTVRAQGKEYTESYDKLLLSCGAKAIIPRVKGMGGANNIFSLRSVSDTLNIKRFIDETKPQTAVVIGGGLIGAEMAENMANLGIRVTMVEKQRQLFKQLDFEMAQLVHRELNSHGVGIILNDGLEEIADGGKRVVLSSGRELLCDIIIMSVGVTPDNALAKSAGLLLGKRGHVITDKNYNAFDADGGLLDDVYAVGDMIEVTNGVTGQSYAVPLAWGANRQGRLAADAINGIDVPEQTILGCSVAKVFGLTAASAGMNEELLRASGIAYTAVHAQRGNHAGYYPNAQNITLKLLFDKESGKIYGAQAVGGEGTEKRIDVIATAIRLNASAYRLSSLELCYAPPYSAAKDPVNIIGYIAENLRDGAYAAVGPEEISAAAAKNHVVLDVRSAGEFARGAIAGAVNIDVDSLRAENGLLPADKSQPVYLYCEVGMRGYLAANILRERGYTNLYNLSGGFVNYRAYKYVVQEESFAAEPTAVCDRNGGVKCC